MIPDEMIKQLVIENARLRDALEPFAIFGVHPDHKQTRGLRNIGRKQRDLPEIMEVWL